MSSSLSEILHPKANRLKGKDKPGVIIVHSSYEDEDSALNYKAKVKHLKDEGYIVLNKSCITYDDAINVSNNVKSCDQVKGKIVLFVVSHGYPGHFFGKEFNKDNEIEYIKKFKEFVTLCETSIERDIDIIVLGGCHTSAEFKCHDGNYINSPARLLSIIVPSKHIVGFCGTYVDAKVTGLFEYSEDDYYAIISVPENASMVFKNGMMLQHPSMSHLIWTGTTPDYVMDELSIKKYDIIKICYRTQLRPRSYKKNSYGLWQEHIINKISI
jgi:hypothetical protein